MKARIIPPPERVDNRTDEEKQEDLENLYKHIEVMNMLNSVIAERNRAYLDFPGSPIVPDNFGLNGVT